jgi:hypothetical protein
MHVDIIILFFFFFFFFFFSLFILHFHLTTDPIRIVIAMPFGHSGGLERRQGGGDVSRNRQEVLSLNVCSRSHHRATVGHLTIGVCTFSSVVANQPRYTPT